MKSPISILLLAATAALAAPPGAIQRITLDERVVVSVRAMLPAGTASDAPKVIDALWTLAD